MGKNVFANGREVSAKADDNQSIAGLPDVCLSPPSPPAGPIPIPYPNFSKASDTANGTRTVKIGGKEVGQKKKSYYKSSKGDESATKTLGMGFVTHNIQGKTYHAAWSMDVKFEGENAIRFMDLTTHNHMSDPMNSVSTTIDVAAFSPAPPTRADCEELDDENKADREGFSESLSDKGTNANASLQQPNSPPRLMAGHSNGRAVLESDKHESGHGNRRPRSQGGTQSNVGCDDASSFRYRGPEAQCSGHAEPRIIESIFEGSGGSVLGQLTIKIDWIKGDDPNNRSCAPCASCQALMCAASKCGMQIFICDSDNNPRELGDDDCPDNLDMADPNARETMNSLNEQLRGELDNLL